jgi:hypothetical protein
MMAPGLVAATAIPQHEVPDVLVRDDGGAQPSSSPPKKFVPSVGVTPVDFSPDETAAILGVGTARPFQTPSLARRVQKFFRPHAPTWFPKDKAHKPRAGSQSYSETPVNGANAMAAQGGSQPNGISAHTDHGRKASVVINALAGAILRERLLHVRG